MPAPSMGPGHANLKKKNKAKEKKVYAGETRTWLYRW